MAHHVSVQRRLPSGTVTFLFTDVEGSTKLLRELGVERYASALAEHRRTLRAAFVAYGGVEVDTQGDAFFVAFPTASSALAAATVAQQGLAVGTIRVRIGIHTGTAYPTEEGYVGEDVHRAARIAAAGHGGQVLFSKETRELVETEPTDLGEHRVKDFTEPVWIFQLGKERFPPLRTISNTNLPRAVSAFVGRQRELGDVTALLEDGARLLTLSGAGGSGKTRLAIEAAVELIPSFRNGVFWVGLAALRDPSLVLSSIAQTLGAKDDLAGHIADRHLLLLIDNFEQVGEAGSELARLLELCPNLRLLVTSRELLRARGEVAYPVPPLTEPDAVELFCLRSRLEPDRTIASLCGHLDNLPLAVELAAARTTALSPKQILARLSERLDLLKGGRDTEARQRTLRATIAWSYDLLVPAERRLFARLAVFRGGCTLESAEQVAGAELDVLQSLVEKSLLRVSDERFWMFETIREYALERLDESAEAEQLRRDHAQHILALARDAEPQLAGPQADRWIRLLDFERDNVRAALERSLGRSDAALALEIASALERYWWIRCPAEGLTWLERGLREPDLRPELRGAALGAAGGAAYFSGQIERSVALFYDGLELSRSLGDQAGIARMLARLGPPLYVAGRVEEGAAHVAEAVSINRELKYTFGLVESLHILSGAARERGELERAEELLEESLGFARELDDSLWICWNLFNLADVALRRGDPSRAWSLAHEALSAARINADEMATLNCLGILAVAAVKRGKTRQAGLLWGTAERLDHELGETVWSNDRDFVEQQLGRRSRAFEQAAAEGRALTPDEVIALIAHPAPSNRR